MTRLKKPIPTKQEIEADLQKLAELFDGYASRIESLWERRRDLAAIFKKSILDFSKKSKPFLKKNIVLLEIKLQERQ